VPGEYLLDTNIVIALRRGDMRALARVALVDRIWLCSIVLGELYRGAFNSRLQIANLTYLDLVATSNGILVCDAATARLYGEIKQSLIRKGRPIPENDIWIAAIARQHGLTLATRDSDFQHVDGLVAESW
jgi:tRNA(fMet)-specific endonuclease VapC